ncbi:transglutaminase domain-containing protein [Streptomyces sp. ICBB 8177]|uniref:DUF3488 and transglutaminase-like domain-containing protein n=1 Tax=Streptomyces sp. ICBB 8177 TaxID=563922 RepID=UPI001F541392|nr:transglutaminase domain-containing protein [Streptomyces sp. ICBB 8177]
MSATETGTGTGSRPARVRPAPAAGNDWEWAAPAPTAAPPPHAPGPAGPHGAPSPGAGAPHARVPRRRRLLVSLLPLVLLLAVSGCGFLRVYPAARLAPVVAVAVLAPMTLSVLLSGALSRRRATLNPLWPSVLLTVVGWLVTVCATLFRHSGGGLPTPAAMSDAWSALLDAPRAVLTTILPVPGTPALLVLPHAVLWLASFATAELGLRTKGPLLPALPGVVAFGVPVVFGVGGPGPGLVLVGALAACAGLVALTRGRVAPSWRSLAVGLPTVAALAVVAGAVGPYLPGVGAPYDPRHTVTPPITRPMSVSPLDEVAVWMRAGTQPVFTVRTSGGDGGQNYRLAVLDSYDGVTWSSDARLERTGGRVPSQPGVDPGGTQKVVQHFTVDSLPGIWLPAADRPVQVSAPASADLAVDPAGGTLTVGGSALGPDQASVRAGYRYTATSEVPVYDASRLQYAPAADDPAMTELPRTDAAGQPIEAVSTFTRTAAQATAGATFPYEQAVKLADWLRDTYHFDPTALPGHSYRQLEFFLTSGKRGTSEQFAAAFAVMARTLDLPSRVVVGFRQGVPVGGGTYQVRGQDVLAWPEVEFQGIGWVPFYPTPDAASAHGASVAPAGQPKQRQQVDQKITQQPRSATPPRKDGVGGQAAAPGRAGGPPPWLYAPLAVLALAVCYLLRAAWVPWRRRARRRGDPDPGRRVLGAWQQIVDRLTEIGLPPTGAHTAAEVAAFGAERVGGAAGEHLPALAELVNQVGYAGRAPDAAAADAAWRHCDAVERVVVASRPRRERLRRALRPSALLGRR